MKRFLILVVAVVSVLFGLATAPAYAFNQAHLTKLQSTNQCKDCDLTGADLTGANLMGADLELLRNFIKNLLIQPLDEDC